MFVFRSTGCLHEITVPEVNMVSRRVDVPNRLLLVEDLCRLGSQMQNIPSRQLRTGARDMKQNIIKRILPLACVLHKLIPQRKHFNSVWYSEKKPAGSSTWTPQLEKAGGLLYRAYRALCPAHVIRLDYINVKDYRYINCCNVTQSYVCSKCSTHKSTCMRQAYGSNNGVTKKRCESDKEYF